MEYWEIGQDMVQHFSWVTNLRVSKRNVYQLMRGGRARWKGFPQFRSKKQRSVVTICHYMD
jgi:hypothetical protein